MNKSTLHLKFDTREPDISRLREIARGCREGKITAFPTETVYGIGGPMSVPNLSSALSELKSRSPEKPYAYHIGDLNMLEFLGVRMSPQIRYLSEKFWPGPLTVLVKNKQGQKVGIRYPRNRLTTALINTVGEPFIATSANKSGEPSAKSAQEVISAFEGRIDYVIDGGRCELGQDSTIVDLAEENPTVVREGASAGEIKFAVQNMNKGQFARKRILIVCTGNSCRSPMAEGWLKSQLAHEGLNGQIEVKSCGVGARNGNPATPEAVLTMRNRDVDISQHRSRVCTREDLLNADLVFAMGREHANFITGLVPAARSKIEILDIPDPIGMGILLYEEVFNSIERKLKDKWNKIIA